MGHVIDAPPDNNNSYLDITEIHVTLSRGVPIIGLV